MSASHALQAALGSPLEQRLSKRDAWNAPKGRRLPKLDRWNHVQCARPAPLQQTRPAYPQALAPCNVSLLYTHKIYIYPHTHAHNFPIVLLQVLFMMNHNVRQMTLLLCRSSTQVLPALPTGLRHPMAVPCARSARTSVSLPFPDLRNVTAPWKDISLTQPLQR